MRDPHAGPLARALLDGEADPPGFLKRLAAVSLPRDVVPVPFAPEAELTPLGRRVMRLAIDLARLRARAASVRPPCATSERLACACGDMRARAVDAATRRSAMTEREIQTFESDVSIFDHQTM